MTMAMEQTKRHPSFFMKLLGDFTHKLGLVSGIRQLSVSVFIAIVSPRNLHIVVGRPLLHNRGSCRKLLNSSNCASFSLLENIDGQDLLGSEFIMPRIFYSFLYFDDKKIPQAFLKNFQGNVPKILLVKCGGRSWFIRTEESDEGYQFSQGLAEFVKDLHLELGELVIFSMVGHDLFEVVVYDTDCCEKNTISARSYERQPCAYAEGESGRSDGVKKEEEESVMEVERHIPARHPQFVRPMRKYEMHKINLPAAFVREAGLKPKRSVVIEDPQRRTWPVRLCQYVKGTTISGWSSVVKANDITIGDTLMLEYLRGSGDTIALRIVSRAARDGAGPAYEKRA